MAGGWAIVAHYLLPPPIIIMTLLVVPLPKSINFKVKRLLLRIVDKFMSIRVLENWKIVHMMIFITGIVFLGTVHDTIKLHRVAIPVDATPNHQIGVRASRWRAERNFWIGFISFFTWGIMGRFVAIKRQLLDLEEENKTLKIALSDAGVELSPPGSEGPSSRPFKPLEVEEPSEPKKQK